MTLLTVYIHSIYTHSPYTHYTLTHSLYTHSLTHSITHSLSHSLVTHSRIQTGSVYPLCVKLGTITANSADVWSYAPDEDCKYKYKYNTLLFACCCSYSIDLPTYISIYLSTYIYLALAYPPIYLPMHAHTHSSFLPN